MIIFNSVEFVLIRIFSCCFSMRNGEMPYNGLRYETLRISEHKTIRPLHRLLIVMSLKYSTIRAMFYDRLLCVGVYYRFLLSSNLIFLFSKNTFDTTTSKP